MHLGIDASNIRQGGGITHLSQLLSSALPADSGITHITVWCSTSTSGQLPDHPWLTKLTPDWTEATLCKRMIYQQFFLSNEVHRCGCDVLFSPGGMVPFFAHLPLVTMSQNMLPFEPNEAIRFGRWSLMRLKMWLIRQFQISSFKKADGLIFLTNYARLSVSRWLVNSKGSQIVIPHGVEPRFNAKPKKQKLAHEYTQLHPFTFLYVSILMPYKHQIQVAIAANELRQHGYPVKVRFIGAGWGTYGMEFREKILQLDPNEDFLIWQGDMPFAALHNEYLVADAFLFASSCENLPNILIEAMTSGLPIASSNRGPMREILGNAGVYFDPLEPHEIASVMRTFIDNPDLRTKLANQSYELSHSYSWPRCAKETFDFIAAVTSQCEVN